MMDVEEEPVGQQLEHWELEIKVSADFFDAKPDFELEPGQTRSGAGATYTLQTLTRGLPPGENAGFQVGDRAFLWNTWSSLLGTGTKFALLKAMMLPGLTALDSITLLGLQEHEFEELKEVYASESIQYNRFNIDTHDVKYAKRVLFSRCVEGPYLREVFRRLDKYAGIEGTAMMILHGNFESLGEDNEVEGEEVAVSVQVDGGEMVTNGGGGMEAARSIEERASVSNGGGAMEMAGQIEERASVTNEGGAMEMAGQIEERASVTNEGGAMEMAGQIEERASVTNGGGAMEMAGQIEERASVTNGGGAMEMAGQIEERASVTNGGGAMEMAGQIEERAAVTSGGGGMEAVRPAEEEVSDSYKVPGVTDNRGGESTGSAQKDNTSGVTNKKASDLHIDLLPLLWYKQDLLDPG
ncbi:uncharacterized protein L3040_002049 [Drepanopeziza brunnea f. sp. 'multigermtubi']|uniref:uncharacterized protein n=1 Tax=Drepanopeziza brunnea f. sp. 'multigermtubi' TaxID=698441 RepID=UPI002396EBAE|nr:hypothetical protein L3040_002049 [Drepanopeziza brunnea f. sp. 'multigermtubi']